ncbi:hypothetical protein [Variovorax sp. GT1P44]|uniref:hypothetical protein n=1 Tax=Variovorax sp. GT1P44 TaxID=3443742 RepID=UPI003F4968A9
MNKDADTEHFWYGVMTTTKKTGAEAYAVAVDVIRDRKRPKAMAVLISSVKDENERVLECRFGLTNVVAWGDAFRARGIPAAETLITLHPASNSMTVRAPLRAMTGDEPEDPEAPVLITLSGVRFCETDSVVASRESFPVVYSTMALSPAVGSPDREVFALAETVHTLRDSLARLESVVSMQVHDTILPELKAFSGEHFELSLAWSGVLNDRLEQVLQRQPGQTPKPRQAGYAGGTRHSPPPAAAHPPAPIPAPAWTRQPKPYSATGYRFTDVEFVGMRVDLRPYGSDADDLLEDLIRPLNFHLDAPDPADAMSFKYRPAARSLVIELVRYGRMYWGKDVPTDEPDYFESQFELLMRVLVGRVDDGSAQARDPAVFVPAIFVDNPWSKLIGREYQGFEKRMARFVDKRGDAVLSTSSGGRDRGSPLFDIAGIEQLASLAPGTPGVRIADIELPPIPADWYCNAEPVDSFGVSLAAGPRWRQSDFSHREFRRSFARDVLADGLDSFHSIQVAAIDNRPLPFAWITGTFTLQGLRAIFPRGVATLTLKDHESLPCAFRQLCRLMQGEPITMPTGDWYVGKSSVDLKVDDGLV